MPPLRRRPLLTAAAGVVAGSGAVWSVSPAAASAPGLTVIRGASMIDGTGAEPRSPVTVVLEGETIRHVLGPREAAVYAAPEYARVVDGGGLTLLPGFIDSHIHWHPWMGPLFLRFGVTTVRDVGNQPSGSTGVREDTQAGRIVGPRLHVHGPLLDGNPPTPGASLYAGTTLTSVERAQQVARDLIRRGVDGLKLYVRLPLPLAQAICDIAREQDVPVAAHLGAFSAREAADLGVRSIEHITGVNFTQPAEEHARLIDHLIERGTFLVPTTIIYAEHPIFAREKRNGSYPHLDVVPPAVAAQWQPFSENDFLAIFTPDQRDGAERFMVARNEFIGAFHRAGGQIASGSDVGPGVPYRIPGYTIHQELRYLVGAGLSPLAAIHSVTGAAAALLKRPELGVIREGAAADLFAVRGDPSQDIAAAEEIAFVFKGGSLVHGEPA